MMHQVATLSGAWLDAAVAKCEGEDWMVSRQYGGIVKRSSGDKVDRCQKLTRDDIEEFWFDEDRCSRAYKSCIDGERKAGFWLGYSTHWELGGPIMQRELISVAPAFYDPATFCSEPSVVPLFWRAMRHYPMSIGGNLGGRDTRMRGRTALEAAMREYVRSKFGDEVNL